MNLADNSVLCFDTGLFLSFALRLAAEDGFGTVYYANERRKGRPSFNDHAVGKGYDQITVVDNPWKGDLIDNVDVIAFPDCTDWDWQEYLRRNGKAVWGSGRGAELENYRIYAKEMMKALGLPVGKYVVVKGIDSLRSYLRENPDQVIKVSLLRGLMETRKHKKYWMTEPFIDWLAWRLGPEGKTQEFIVEQQIDAKIEVGFDGLYFAERFASVAINGVEIKDAAYLGVVQDYSDLSPAVRDVCDKFSPVLAKMDYANFFSQESRIDSKGVAYPIDLTCRLGSPSGEAQLAAWTNLPQLVWAGAHGEYLDPDFDERFVAQAMIFNKGDENDWVGVEVPTALESNVNLYYSRKVGGQHWVVPQVTPFDELGSVTAKGNTAEEAIKRCKEMAKRIDGDIYVKTDELDDALKEFDLMDKKGINVEAVSA